MIRILSYLLLLSFSTPGIAGENSSDFPVPPKGVRYYEIGKAEDFTLPDMDEDRISLSGFRGRWVFLHFWASWCGPCRKEMPTINHLTNTFTEDELKIIMVNTAEDEDTIFSFLGEIQMDVPVYMDRDGLVTEVWKPRGLPTTFLIDPQGYVRYQAIGGREWHHPLYIDFLRRLTERIKLDMLKR